ncbi:MAG: biotin/lipoyl-binding protein [Bacillati bacterium ANGP1]|uniref:Biotin/lipoyl-binding protein n=1 Tax=Candidatus Segetimicrobium genomatis TaxID=2569760 RepID=A0A537JPS6_9BACT|nr:MAG: biotin/lipoyl-binding protein [Terrabacteria group bacterium ANGP1]
MPPRSPARFGTPSAPSKSMSYRSHRSSSGGDSVAKRVEVVAPVPGLVANVVVKKGAKVKQGDPIAVLQSMKMEIPIPSEHSGTVSEVLVEAGQEIDTKVSEEWSNAKPDAGVSQGAGRQSGRDRRPDHPGLPGTGDPDGGHCFAGGPGRAPCGDGR